MPCEIVVFWYHFGVHFVNSLLSFLPHLRRRFVPLGTLVAVRIPPFLAGSRLATSPGSISYADQSFDWDNPSMNYLYHRPFLYLVPYVHKVEIKGNYQKFPRLRNIWYHPVNRRESRRKGTCTHERSNYHIGTPLGTTQGQRAESGRIGITDAHFKICPCQL